MREPAGGLEDFRSAGEHNKKLKQVPSEFSGDAWPISSKRDQSTTELCLTEHLWELGNQYLNYWHNYLID